MIKRSTAKCFYAHWVVIIIGQAHIYDVGAVARHSCQRMNDGNPERIEATPSCKFVWLISRWLLHYDWPWLDGDAFAPDYDVNALREHHLHIWLRSAHGNVNQHMAMSKYVATIRGNVDAHWLRT